MNDNGTLSFATAIDTSGFDEGIKNMEAKVGEVTANIEQESGRMKEALVNIPKVDIDFTTNAATSLETINAAFEMIDAVVNENSTQIKALEADYAHLAQLSAEAFNSGADEEYRAIEQDRRAVKALISARKEAIVEAEKTADKLAKVEQNLKKEANAAASAGGKNKTLRNQIMELTLQLAELEMQGKANTQEFFDMQAKAAMLQDQMGDTRAQIQILANDEAGFAGMMSAMSGVSGGFTALTAAMSIFGDENEDLSAVMVKLQQVMALTMGLQQVAQMLNKDSAASIVVLNGLKQWWHKITLEATGAQVAENIATAEGAVATTAEAAAVAANTAATTANTAATTAQTAADVAQATASTGAAAAEGAQTAATITQAGAAAAGTAANWSLAAAFRAVGAAIKSIPVIGWILAGVSALIGVISALTGETEEEKEAREAANEAAKAGNEAYIKGKLEIEDYTNRLQTFNGTKAQEKKLVEELNSKYGEQLGYHSSVSGWLKTLVDNGETYCEVLRLEAIQQALVNKYTEAYCKLLEVKAQAENGDFNAWYRWASWDKKVANEHIAEAQASEQYWEAQMKANSAQLKALKAANNIGGHINPNAGAGGNYDPQKAAVDVKKAIDSWKKSMKEYLKKANDEISAYSVELMAEGMAKEINQIYLNVHNQKRAWKENLLSLAEAKKNSMKDIYMTQKGATEAGWLNSEGGKKSVQQYADEMLQDPEFAKKYYDVVALYTKDGEKKVLAVRKKYEDAWIDEYGTYEQRRAKLVEEWIKKLEGLPQEYVFEATKKMDEELSALDTEKFKDAIDWESVFGDLDKQSTTSIGAALQRVKQYFEGAKASMSTEDIKIFQEAISDMENEIASRSPFAAFGKSIRDIISNKEDFVSALKEMETTQRTLTQCEQEYQEAKAAVMALEQEYVQGEGDPPIEETEAYIAAQDRLVESTTRLQFAQDASNKAERRAMAARNGIMSSYKNLAKQIKSVGGVITGLGENAKNLAGVFSSNVAKGIGKAIDTIDVVMNATGDCIDALADTGKSVSNAMVQTASASGQAMTATATASATAISTVEKASVILAVISAALQVATAIAGLFNNDEELQERIDGLQSEIDALQWELDNMNVVTFEESMGKAFENVANIMSKARQEAWAAAKQVRFFWSESAMWQHFATIEADAYDRAVKKIADTYAAADYTANKLLGSAKWDNSRAQLDNYAEQMVKTQQQIEAEKDKKETDYDQIAEWERQMSEMAEKMAEVINEMVEGIIGGSATDIATQLGDAFFEACENGEDAMEAWAKSAKEIVRNILKQMLIAQFLEKPIGDIFNKYKTEWFETDGTFKGIDAVIDTLDDFYNELNSAVDEGQKAYDAIVERGYEDYFANDERDGTSQGIATASQESVDENNARLTTIQAHTYTLVQGVQELNTTGNMMLERLTGIENNTREGADSLEDMRTQMRSMRETLDDIQLKGIKVK